MSVILAGCAVMFAVVLVACSSTEPDSTPAPVSTHTSTAVANGTPAQTPSPPVILTPTLEPTPTPTQTTAPTSTPLATPTGTPVPTPEFQTSTGRGGLWAGALDISVLSEFGLLPWMALQLVPGEDPDVDLWTLVRGPLTRLPSRIWCSPERLDEGWALGDCIGLRGLAEGSSIEAFVPAEGETGVEIELRLGEATLPTIHLSRVPQRVEPQASANVSLLWHEPGDGVQSDIWAEDGLVYAPRYSDGDIEILDAASGRRIGTAVVPSTNGGFFNIVFDVKANGGILYAATVPSGLVMFDVSQPSTPELIGQYRVFAEEGSPDNFINIHNIFLSPDGNFVYAINHVFPKTELRVIDVSDPTSPREAGRFSIEEEGHGIFTHDVNVIEQDGRLIAFLNYLSAGLRILDVTEPASISELGSIKWDGIASHSGWPFAVDGRLYYANASEGYDLHLTILDVTDLTDPQVSSRFSTRPGLSIHNVEVVDGIGYLSYYVDGLRVVDLRDPANPREVGHFDTVPADDERGLAQGAWGVRVDEGIVYISDIENGTYAFSVDLE